jgi:hypothetical protein
MRKAEPGLHEAVFDLLALGQLLTERDSAVEGAGHVGVADLAAGVDREAVVGIAPLPERIVVLEAEANRIHQGVASGTGRR